MTKILQVLTEYCAPRISDIRLDEKAVDNPPVYAWTMWRYLLPEMARFTIPVEMPTYLFGTTDVPRITYPQFMSARQVISSELTSDTVFALGEDFVGFELFSAHTVQRDASGEIYTLPTALATYDSETGNVTLTASADEPIAAGTVFDFDFYTDGSFAETLSPEIMTILGMCFECGWLKNVGNDWLSIVPKTEDKNFSQQNIANWRDKDTARLKQAEGNLASEMRKFEKNCYYKQTIKAGNRLKI